MGLLQELHMLIYIGMYPCKEKLGHKNCKANNMSRSFKEKVCLLGYAESYNAEELSYNYFVQMDIKGDPFGILAAHPVTPILSIHHLDSISPIFPHMNQVQSLRKLTEAMNVESGSVMQQSICYDEQLKWSFSVSWGYVVHVHYGFLKPHEMEVAIRTFKSLQSKSDASAFSFKLRSYNSKDHCTHPTRYYMESMQGPLNNSNSNSSQGLLESVYLKGDHERRANADCHQPFMEVINSVNRIRVVKEPIPEDWYQVINFYIQFHPSKSF
jgi:hypothetical protein